MYKCGSSFLKSKDCINRISQNKNNGSAYLRKGSFKHLKIITPSRNGVTDGYSQPTFTLALHYCQ
jgi:type IV secretory pathway TraG/TraD family ATPase VirD4